MQSNKELSFIAGGNEKSYSHFGGQFGCFLQSEIVVLLYDPSVAFLGVYPNMLTTYVHTKPKFL